MSAAKQPAASPTPLNDNAGVIAPPPLLFLAPFLAGLLVHWFLPITLALPLFARLLGLPLLLIGLLLNVGFIATMRRAGTPIDPRKPVNHLLTNGIFRFSRNPSYLAFALTYLGVAVLVNSLWPLLGLLIALAAIQFGVIAREERYLIRTFGAEYQEYRSRVRRWL